MTADSSVALDAPRTTLDDEPSAGARRAYWTFVAVLVVALPLLLWIGSYRWFYGDEWSFLTDRSISLDGLFRPHNQQHWVTLPVLAYRGLYSLFGLHAYWPYQTLVVLLHLGAAALLRVVMRRAGVQPWIATAAAVAFVFLGPAEDNILWAFQITFVGSLVAGLAQMILADHDGPIDRRDWIGLGIGLLGLMTSGQAPSLVIGVGLVCVLRRRWGAAIFHTVPLAVVYLVWFTTEHAQTVLRLEGKPFTLRDYVEWMRVAAVGLFTALGHFALLGLVLVAVLVVGVVLAWRSEGAAAFGRRAAVPLALVMVCVVSMTTAAPSRFFFGPDSAKAGRYIGVMAALTLPLLAVAADAVARRWPRLLPALVLLFVLPVPFNLVVFGDDPILSPRYFDEERDFVATLPTSPLVAQVPSWVRPNESILGQPGMTVGWLLQASRAGELPPPTALPANAGPLLPVQLGVATTDEPPPEGRSCATYDRPLAVAPEQGEVWELETGVAVAALSEGKPSTGRVYLVPGVVEITLPDLELLLGPTLGASEFTVCR